MTPDSRIILLGFHSLENNGIALEQAVELLKWEQAAPGRDLQIDRKEKLPQLLKAQENDPAVTTIDLSRASVSPQDIAWLAGVLKVNQFITSLK